MAAGMTDHENPMSQVTGSGLEISLVDGSQLPESMVPSHQSGFAQFGFLRDVSITERPPVMFPLRFRDVCFGDAILTAECRLNCSDVDFCHLHHRIERALGGGGIGIDYRFRQSHRRNLPG
jgi:hypothetical protein